MNIEEARDIMLGHATAALAGVPITYTDVPAALRDGDTAWARATVKHAGGGKTGFGDVTSKHDRFGILCVEVFGPQGDGLTTADVIAQTVLTYLENVRSSPLWYRNIRAVDIGKDGGFQKINVLADFEYTSYH